MEWGAPLHRSQDHRDGQGAALHHCHECETLRKLSSEAWLYRVDLGAGDNGAVILRLQDPMAHMNMERFRVVVWEVDLPMFQDGNR